MPAIPARALVAAVLDAIQQSGYSGVLLSNVGTNPRQFAVSGPDGNPISLWVYIWTLTFGGRSTRPHEWRIQKTNVTSPLQENSAGPTVVLGFEPNWRAFAGFDFTHHRTFTPGSPSAFINISVVQQALQDGLTFHRDSCDEIALGIRPDQLMAYVMIASSLHRLGRQAATFNLLQQASSSPDPMPEAALDSLTEERRRIVQTVSRWFRLGSFRQQVLNAYESRCSVTRAQMRLVDAAHIYPVDAPGSVDDVRNGLALSPTYHRAYDHGLIYLDESYVMRINPQRTAILRDLHLDGGLASFETSLGKIFLPHDRQQWPEIGMIRRGNQIRGIQMA